MLPAVNLNYIMQYVTTERNPNSNYEFAMQKIQLKYKIYILTPFEPA
jgi:hypothetical protein